MIDEHQGGGHDGDGEGEGADGFEETRGANVFTEGHTVSVTWGVAASLSDENFERAVHSEQRSLPAPPARRVGSQRASPCVVKAALPRGERRPSTGCGLTCEAPLRHPKLCRFKAP